ncbi:hypothetical protein NDU88_007774 [Pleurodeles waltl]|uniref:inositol-polyphosphate 5-phosphatase n=1 Tax=Pleurodeles waltl TaxID=8319 RepID=A0AAV7QPT0_PLEWA|nr:hypothetical protein NDU88_007774 [Pleurodeles waltl]
MQVRRSLRDPKAEQKTQGRTTTTSCHIDTKVVEQSLEKVCMLKTSQFTIGHMAPSSVWVIGHSFVRRALPFFNLYRSWAQGTGLRILWIARGGLCLDGLRQLIEEVLRRRLPPPALIILHVGGNDLPTIGRRSVFEDLMVEISWLAKQCPGAVIAWSHIITRRIWSITDHRYEKVPYLVFGDFNFRLDLKSVVETLCAKTTMQTIRATDTNAVDKLIFHESENDRKVVLQIEKKLFEYFNQDVFRDNNGTALLEFDKELSVFKDKLYELDISFPPSYPYSEDSSQGKQYMNTRCPAWCDRIVMSHSAKELLLKSENDEKIVTYDNIGPNICMGDHKPVFLSFRIAAGAGKRCPRNEKIFRETTL